MTDWTHSFVRDASTLPERHGNHTFPPPKEANTTILKLDCSPEPFLSLETLRPGDPHEEISETTEEGLALIAFLEWIVEEPGHDFVNWSRVLEIEEALMIIIGWDTRPSPAFQSSESLNRSSPPSSSLAALRLHLRSEPGITNVAFSQPLFSGSQGFLRDPYLQELLIWTIPPHLDPTYQHDTAVPFDALKWFLSVKQHEVAYGQRHQTRELSSHQRGWMSDSNAEANKLPPPGAMRDPSEKTHVFVFNWRDGEAEMRCKNDSNLEDNAEGRAKSWKRNFTALQREWEGMGMRSESLHLKQVDFWYQWRWRVPGHGF